MMRRKTDTTERLLLDTLADPQGLVLSLIGAEVLATKREDGPLARPWRTTPIGRIEEETPPETLPQNDKEGSRG